MNDLIRRHKIFFIVIVLVLLITLPLIVFQAQQQQTIKQRASGSTGDVSIALSPSSNSSPLKISDEFSVKIQINNSTLTPKYDVTSADVTLEYDPEQLSFVSFTPADRPFSTPIIAESSVGSFHLAVANPDGTNSTVEDAVIDVGTLKFKALKAEKANMAFSAAQVTAAGRDDALSVDYAATGAYTITDGSSSPTSSSEKQVELVFDPPSNSTPLEGIIPVTILMNNPTSLDISTMDITLKYDSGLSYVPSSFQLTAGNNFQSISTEQISDTFHFEAVSLASTKGENINIGTLQFKAEKTGPAEVKFKTAIIKSISQPGVDLTVDASAKGTYTVSAAGSDPIATLTPAPTEDPALSPTITITTTPTLSPAPGDTVIKLPEGAFATLFTIKNDKSPVSKKSQKLTMYLYDSTVNPNSDPKGERAAYKADADIDPSGANLSFNFKVVNPGTYKALLKGPKFLRTSIGTLIVPAAGGTLNIATLDKHLADGTGDVDNSNTINIADYRLIMGCWEKLPICAGEIAKNTDLNDDNVTDQIDHSIFLKSLSFAERNGD